MYKNIDKAFAEIAQEKVTKKRKSPLGAIIFTVIGLAVAFLDRFVPAIAGSVDLTSALIIVGWSLALFGIVKLVLIYGGNSWDFHYQPTGEKLKKYELSYEASDKARVQDFVTGGRFDKLAGIPRSSSTSVKVTLYAIPHKEVLWAQVFEFVPHVHEPVTEAIAFEKGQCPLPHGLV